MVTAMRTDRLALVLSLVLFWARPVSGAAPDPAPTPVRVDRSGSLDRTFGVDGVVDAMLGSAFGASSRWSAVTVLPDGRIVVAGSESDDLVTARYDPTGALDTSFGDGGIVAAPLPHGGNARAVATTGSGDIVVVGAAYGDPASGYPTDALVLRLHADGTLDDGFGAGGIVTIELGKNDDEARAIVTQGSGRIVVLADSNGPELMNPSGSVVLLGLRPNGQIDRAFGDAGRVGFSGTVDEVWSGDAMVRTPNGDILVAVTSFAKDGSGSDTYEFQLARFDRDGNERRRSDVLQGYAFGLGLLDDGSAVVSGSFLVGMTSHWFLRFAASGSLDPTFGDRLPAVYTQPGAIVVDQRNRIVLASNVVTRYFADGIFEDSYGDGGVAESSAGMHAFALAVQPDGKIIVAGQRCSSDPDNGFLGCIARLARYESDATRLCGDADGDETFSVTDGVATLRAAAFLPSTCSYEVCDVDGDGTIGVTDGVNVLRAAAELPAGLTCGVGDAN